MIVEHEDFILNIRALCSLYGIPCELGKYYEHLHVYDRTSNRGIRVYVSSDPSYLIGLGKIKVLCDHVFELDKYIYEGFCDGFGMRDRYFDSYQDAYSWFLEHVGKFSDYTNSCMRRYR